MALKLSVGSGPVTLIQSGTPTAPLAGPTITVTLPTASTAGTALIAIAGGQTTPTIGAFPSNWTRLITASEASASGSEIDVWICLNNPGGITSVSFGASSGAWTAHLSEWANVYTVGTLEASGSATASSGTTLAPTTSTNVLTAGDLAISVWMQVGAGVPVYTTPVGFTRLTDTASSGTSGHIDAEYKVNPTTGATLGPTLTSSMTSGTASGVIVVLKPAPPVADQSAYLAYGSLTLKLNTLDFALVDCPMIVQNSAIVTLSSPGEYPDWTGNVAQVNAADMVDRATGHNIQMVVATNTQPPNSTGSPFDLSDSPAADTTTLFQLESGAGNILLEDGTGSYLTEGTLEYSYQGLSIGTQVGSTAPVSYTTIGYVTVFQVGMWPGMIFKLTSANLASWIVAPGSLYTIQTIVITYHGANPPTPVYQIQFGDVIQTLAQWTKVHAV